MVGVTGHVGQPGQADVHCGAVREAPELVVVGPGSGDVAELERRVGHRRERPELGRVVTVERGGLGLGAGEIVQVVEDRGFHRSAHRLRSAPR